MRVWILSLLLLVLSARGQALPPDLGRMLALDRTILWQFFPKLGQTLDLALPKASPWTWKLVARRQAKRPGTTTIYLEKEAAKSFCDRPAPVPGVPVRVLRFAIDQPFALALSGTAGWVLIGEGLTDPEGTVTLLEGEPYVGFMARAIGLERGGAVGGYLEANPEAAARLGLDPERTRPLTLKDFCNANGGD